MKKSLLIALCLFVAPLFCPSRAAAQTQLTVQSTLGPVAIDVVCLLRGCKVTQTVAGSTYKYYVVTAPSSTNANFLASILQTVPGILNVTINNLAGPNGLLLGKGGLYGNVLRISPPLNIGKSDIDNFMHALDGSFSECAISELVGASSK